MAVTEPENKVSKPNLKLQPNTYANLGSWWRVLLTVLGIFIASQAVAFVFLQIYLDLANIKSLEDGLKAYTPAQFLYIFVAEAVVVLLVFQFLQLRKLGLGAIGWGRRPKWRDLKFAVIGFLFFFVSFIAIAAIILSLFPSLGEETQELGFEALNSSFDHTLALIALVILAPVGEETLMRGYLFSGLRHWWRFLPAALITSLLFGLAHLQFGGGQPGVLLMAGINTFMLSMVLVYLREKTGALYACVLVHFLNNLLAYVIRY